MRIFFAAAIGFQVPIKTFGKGSVIVEGLIFTLALFGKIAVGFIVPNFYPTKRFTGNHIRDVLATGFSMVSIFLSLSFFIHGMIMSYNIL